jgi:hypothetical protein
VRDEEEEMAERSGLTGMIWKDDQTRLLVLQVHLSSEHIDRSFTRSIRSDRYARTGTDASGAGARDQEDRRSSSFPPSRTG